ncbi:hypothetical protein GH5_01553 [Leishmania sp. Ghana 2012 LV757]|uniref:hypothetical protein n=1 Tax=Leishmania sp. Ghana 2012 LV757 TaxID=2803181 RepID=UPI001B775B28|nr:hypothetical protein GH5_01553 [Leishmania sp. Ghana 2012 LV757]
MGRHRTKGMASLSAPVQPLSPSELCEATPIRESSRPVSPSQAAESFQPYQTQNTEASEEHGHIALAQSQAVPDVSPLASPPAAAYNPHRSRTSSLTPFPADLAEFTSTCLPQDRQSGNPPRHSVPASRRVSSAFAPWPSTGFAQLPHLGDESSASFLASIAVSPTSRRSSCSYSDSLAVQRRARNDASPVALGNPSVIRHLAKRRERRMSEAARSRRSSGASALASFSQDMMLRSPRENGRTLSRSTRCLSVDSSAMVSQAAMEASRRFSMRIGEAQPSTDGAAEELLSGRSAPLILHSEEQETISSTKSGVKKVRRMTQEVFLPASVASSLYRRGENPFDHGDASQNTSRGFGDEALFEVTPSAGPCMAGDSTVNEVVETPLFVGKNGGAASGLCRGNGVRSHRGSAVTEDPKAGGGDDVAEAAEMVVMRSPPPPPPSSERVKSTAKDEKFGKKVRRFFSFLSPTRKAHNSETLLTVESTRVTSFTAVSALAELDPLAPATDATTPTAESPLLSANDTKMSTPEQVPAFGNLVLSPCLLDYGLITLQESEAPAESQDG